jgi:hypothetical protein
MTVDVDETTDACLQNFEAGSKSATSLVAGYVASTDYEGSGRGLLQGDIWLVRIDD